MALVLVVLVFFSEDFEIRDCLFDVIQGGKFSIQLLPTPHIQFSTFTDILLRFQKIHCHKNVYTILTDTYFTKKKKLMGLLTLYQHLYYQENNKFCCCILLLVCFACKHPSPNSAGDLVVLHPRHHHHHRHCPYKIV